MATATAVERNSFFKRFSHLRPRVISAITLVSLLATFLIAGTYFLVEKASIITKSENSLMEVIFKHAPAQLVTPLAQRSNENFKKAVENINAELSQIGAMAILVDQNTNQQYSSPFSAVNGLAGVSNKSGPSIPENFIHTINTENGKFFQITHASGSPAVVVGSRLLEVKGNNKDLVDSGVSIYGYMPLDNAQSEIRTLFNLVTLCAAIAMIGAIILGVIIAHQLLRPLKQISPYALDPHNLDSEQKNKNHSTLSLTKLIQQFNDNAHDLQDSLQKIKAKEADSRRFVADVSHELRTPIASMVIIIEVLNSQMEKMPPASVEAANIISSEIKRLHKLTEDLLEVSKLDAHNAPIHMKKQQLYPLVLETLKIRHWEKTVTVKGDAEATIDSRRFDVVIANLVVNAIKHGKEPIEVSIEQTPENITVAVSNQGETIPADVLANVFKRFYKGDPSRGVTGGSGLGLSIAGANMQLMGGTIKATSENGLTTFTAIFPQSDTSEKI